MKISEGFHSGKDRPTLTSDGIIEGLLGKVTRLIGRVQDLVVKDGEIQSKTKANGMRRWQIGGCDLRCRFVRFQ